MEHVGQCCAVGDLMHPVLQMEALLKKLSAREKAIPASGVMVAQTEQLLKDLEDLDATAEVMFRLTLGRLGGAINTLTLNESEALSLSNPPD